MQDPTRPLLSGTCTACCDGDTIRCTIDLPLGLTLPRLRIRLAGIQCPELRGPYKLLAQAARSHAETLAVGSPLLIEPIRDTPDRYGRIVAWVWIRKPSTLWSLNRLMIDAGHAHAWAPKSETRALQVPPPHLTIDQPCH